MKELSSPNLHLTAYYTLVSKDLRYPNERPQSKHYTPEEKCQKGAATT